MAQWVKATGEILEVKPKSKGKKFTLDELQGFVGGYIERLQLPVLRQSDGQRLHRMDMIVNEDGKVIGLPVNQAASAIAAQRIVGDVLICARGEW